MLNKYIRVKCIKDCKPNFIKNKVYEAETINIVLTSAPQLVVNDDTGYKNHIIAEGCLNDDEWFKEYFEVI